MRYLLLILVVATACTTARCGDVIKTIVCDTWRGWGSAYSDTTVCSNSIALGCDAMFDIVPNLLEFLTSLNFQSLLLAISKTYIFVAETSKQFSVCKYYRTNLVSFSIILLPLAAVVYMHARDNAGYVWSDMLCVYKNFFDGYYYQAGLCLGHLQKVLIKGELMPANI